METAAPFPDTLKYCAGASLRSPLEQRACLHSCSRVKGSQTAQRRLFTTRARAESARICRYEGREKKYADMEA